MTSKTPNKAKFEETPSDNLPGNLPHIYADGIGQVMVGMPISKLIFHRTVNTNSEGDVDRPVAVLTMPTHAMLEFVLAFNTMAKGSSPGLLSALDTQSHKTRQLIEQFLQQATEQQDTPPASPAKRSRAKG